MKKQEVATFLKSDLLKSERYKDKRDVIHAVLENERAYSLEEVDKLINNFARKGVK